MIETRNTQSIRLRVNLIANFAGQGWIAISGIIFAPIYLKYLGVEAYGIIGFFTVTTAVASLLDGGLSPAITREFSSARSSGLSENMKRPYALLFSIEIMFIVLSITFIILSFFLIKIFSKEMFASENYANQDIQYFLIIIVLSSIFKVFEGFYKNALIGLDRHVEANLLIMFFVTIRSGFVIFLLATVDNNLLIFLIWQMAIYIIAAITLRCCVYKKIFSKQRFSMSLINEIRPFAINVFFAAILGIFITQLDKIVLTATVKLEDYAFYMLATTVAYGLYQISQPIFQTFYPRFSGCLANNATGLLRGEYRLACQIVSVFVGSTAGFIFFFSADLLFLWTGNSTVTSFAAPILKFLILGAMFHSLLYVPYALQLASGHSGMAVRANIMVVGILAVGLPAAILKFGVLGAAMAWSCGLALMFATNLWLMHRRLAPTIAMRGMLIDMAIPIGVAFLASSIFAYGVIGEHYCTFQHSIIVAVSGLGILFVTSLSTTSGRSAFSMLAKKLKLVS